MPKLTICGGGNAAHVLIALAAHTGWEVDVFAPLADEAERLQAGMVAKGGITAYFDGKIIMGRARRISANPAEVIPGSELILLALPAFAHGSTLQTIACCLDPGTAIGVLPARGGFDYQARSILDIDELSLRLFGLQTLPWACRTVIYGQKVEILGTKADVTIAAFPATETANLAQQLVPLLGIPLTPVTSFLTLTLANTGQLIHPGIMYGLCRGKEDAVFTADKIPLFYQGVDQLTADLLQAMSDDVQAIAAVVAAQSPNFDPQEVVTLYEWVLHAYSDDIVDGSDLRRAFNTNKAYNGLKVPTRPAGPDTFAVDFTARYLAEDVPYGLVVLRGIAQLANVATPTIDEVIIWAQTQLGKQYLVDNTLSGSDLAETRAPQAYGILDFGLLFSSMSSIRQAE
jgi:hypothetical protein